MSLAKYKNLYHSAFIITCLSGAEEQTRAELRQVIPGIDFGKLPLPDSLLLLSPLEEAETTCRLRQAAAHSVATASPIQVQFGLRPTKDEVAGAIVDVVEYLDNLKADDSFWVNCACRGQHSFEAQEIVQAVVTALQAGTGAQGESSMPPDWVVNVEIFQSLAFVGVSPAANVIHQQSWVARRPRPRLKRLSRVEQKLREALIRFDICLTPEACVLVLGADSPEWITHLADLARTVYVVEPNILSPILAALPNVVHICCPLEEFAVREDFVWYFDLIASDSRLEADESAQLMLKVAPLLKPDGQALMTIRYQAAQRRRQEKEACAILALAYTDIRLEHLPHNRLETTAALRRNCPTLD